MTLLVNVSTTLMDIEEAHLRFAPWPQWRSQRSSAPLVLCPRCARPASPRRALPVLLPDMRHLARAGCAVEVRMGMPTLKRFARPLDWANLDTLLRRYARKVRKAHAENQGQQVRRGPFLPDRSPAKSLVPARWKRRSRPCRGDGGCGRCSSCSRRLEAWFGLLSASLCRRCRR